MRTSRQTQAKRNLKKAYPSDQKERGEWVELLFMAEAARMGLKVARPHGDSARFDVIVESDGKLHRVQVKSTAQKHRAYYSCTCSWIAYERGTSSGNPKLDRHSWKLHKNRYTTAQADFIAAYVIPDDVWYIIPVTDLTTATLCLPARDYPGANRYRRYAEAWHLLGVKTQGLTIHAAADLWPAVIALLKEKVADSFAR
ncbi:MAG: group I intron-associated PD-(D/E)XK endonuclease [Terriglobales bacterium]